MFNFVSKLYKILFGKRPKAGFYRVCYNNIIREIKEEDILNKSVIIRYKYFDDDYMSFREFHCVYDEV